MDIETYMRALLGGPVGPPGPADQPYNPAAKLASGIPLGVSISGPGAPGGIGMIGRGVTPPVNPSQFGSVPGLPSTLTSNPGMGQAASNNGFGDKVIDFLQPGTSAAKGGASGR